MPVKSSEICGRMAVRYGSGCLNQVKCAQTSGNIRFRGGGYCSRSAFRSAVVCNVCWGSESGLWACLSGRTEKSVSMNLRLKRRCGELVVLRRHHPSDCVFCFLLGGRVHVPVPLRCIPAYVEASRCVSPSPKMSMRMSTEFMVLELMLKLN